MSQDRKEVIENTTGIGRAEIQYFYAVEMQ
jgi:hypothetical protein